MLGLDNSLSLYEAFQCLAQFVAYGEGVAIDGEVGIGFQFLEVESYAAVVPAREGDELAIVEARVAPVGILWQSLDERVVSVLADELLHDGVVVTAQQTAILLARLHASVAAEDSFQVTAQVSVAVPTFMVGENNLFHFFFSGVKVSSRTRTMT